jgi:hypothetical protein
MSAYRAQSSSSDTPRRPAGASAEMRGSCLPSYTRWDLSCTQEPGAAPAAGLPGAWRRAAARGGAGTSRLLPRPAFQRVE